MGADYTPTLGNYTELKPFRYWCQKVLPLVYDDSLSYYELLCKVVDYLNKTMEDVEVLHEDVDDLHEAYELLQTYVNTYFDNLDVQEEINNKLDAMVTDGTFNTLLAPYMQHYQNELNVMKGRIDVLETNYDAGGTTADAELADIRVGYNGTVYDSAGDAVRDQIESVNDEIDRLEDRTDTVNLIKRYGITEDIVLDDDGTTHSDSRFITTDYMPISDAELYVTEIKTYTTGFTVYICGYTSGKVFVNYRTFDQTVKTRDYVPTTTSAYVRLSISKAIYEVGFDFRLKYSLFDSYDNSIEQLRFDVDEAEDIIHTYNYAAPMIEDIVLKSDGTTQADDRFATTDFIAVNPDLPYVTEWIDYSTAFTLLRATYNSSKTLIGYVSITQNTKTRDYFPPQGVAYIKFSVSKTVSPGFRFRYKYNIIEDMDRYHDLNDLARNYSSNLAKTTEFISSYGLYLGELKSDGTFESYPDRYCTGYIPVEYGERYVFNIEGTDGYSPKVCTYGSDKTLIAYLQTDFTAPNYYWTPASASVKFIRFSYSNGVYARNIKFYKVTSKFGEIDKFLLPDPGVYTYQGSPVNLSVTNGFYVTKLFSGVAAPSGTTAQGFAIYNGKLFQILADDTCIVYDLNDGGKYISQFTIDAGHGNSAVFSRSFYSGSDAYPLLYVSDTNGKVYINRVTESSATLTKTLYFNPDNFGATPQFTLGAGNYGYVLGNISGTDYVTSAKVSVCNMSNQTANQDGTYTPEVTDTFTISLTGSYPVLQGLKYLNGMLFMSSGGGSQSVLSKIYVIDIANETVANVITDFPTTMSVEELEDIDFVRNPASAKYDIIAHVRTVGYYRLVF